MSGLFTFLAEHRVGIWVLIASSFGAVLLLHWVSWIFGWGRFGRTSGTDRDLRVVITDFFVKIIDDFRHLLALALVVIFLTTLVVMLWPGIVKGDIAMMESSLKAVVASMGGLIGTIIGYYFGESAAARRAPPVPSTSTTTNQVPEMPPPGGAGGGSEIRKAPSPPPRSETPTVKDPVG